MPIPHLDTLSIPQEGDVIGQESGNSLDRISDISTLTGRTYKALKEAILSFRLKPGAPLVEAQLAKQLGTSKTPVRDALLKLEAEGFVVRVPHTGVYVAQVSWEDIKDIFEVRALLEGWAVRLAVPLLTPEEIARAREVLALSEKHLEQGNVALCAELGREIHQLFLSKVTNRRLLETIRLFHEHVERVRMSNVRSPAVHHKSIQEHRAILALAERGDAAGAEEAMRQHITGVVRDVQALSEEGRK